jgi:transcriptional regulator with XRE-family HTH domain
MSSDSQLKFIGFWVSEKRRGMSQTELAKKAGISQQQLSKIEAGGNLTILTLLKILTALNEKIELPIVISGSGIHTDSNKAEFIHYF